MYQRQKLKGEECKVLVDCETQALTFQLDAETKTYPILDIKKVLNIIKENGNILRNQSVILTVLMDCGLRLFKSYPKQN